MDDSCMNERKMAITSVMGGRKVLLKGGRKEGRDGVVMDVGCWVCGGKRLALAGQAPALLWL